MPGGSAAPVNELLTNNPANCTASVSIDNGSYDPTGQAVTLTQSPTSLQVGQNTVTLTVTNASGFSDSCTAMVTVYDTTKPTFTAMPPDVTSDPCTGEVGDIGQAEAQDNCPGTVSVTNDAPASYPMGVTTVTWTATDASGNTNTYQQKVTRSTDATPPTFTVKPADVLSDPCTGAVGAIGQAQASDNCPGPVTITNNAPSNYPLGVTTVTWTATDTAGNQKTYDQTVTVTTDTTKPVFTSKPADVLTTVCTGVTSIGNATASDNCGGVTITNNAPQTFPIGTTTVTWTATDTAGNQTTHQQIVRVDQAVNLGAEHTISNVPNNACLKVTNYPSWRQYMHTIILQPQASGVGFPIPFTWKNCSATGSGSLPAPWQQGQVSPMNTNCDTLIKLRGNGAGNVSLTWWGNG